MARPTTAAKNEKKMKYWRSQLRQADQKYAKWDKDFPGDYFEGLYTSLEQWPEEVERFTHLFFNGTAANIESLKPALALNKLRANLTPNPAKADDPLSMLEDLVPDMEAIANTLINDPDVGLREDGALAVHESFFRFGVVEVGWGGEVVDNPRAGQVVTNDEGEPVTDPDTGSPVMEPERIPRTEHPWVKRIPASHFRFGPTTEWMARRMPWFGYYEWKKISDLREDERMNVPADLQTGGSVESATDTTADKEENEENAGCVKVWKLWDFGSNTILYIADNYDEAPLCEEKFVTCNICILRYYPILDSPYPKPYITDWVPMQLEANELREFHRTHRRRARRRYLTKNSTFDETQLGQLEHGPDMTIVQCNVNPEGAIVPVLDAPLDPAAYRALPATQSDWDQLSGVPAEARNVGAAGSATQANLIAGSSKGKSEDFIGTVNLFFAEIVQKLLQLMIEKSALPMWVEMVTDPTSPMADQNAAGVAERWKSISVLDLVSKVPGLKDKFLWSVKVEIERARTETTDLERDRFNAFLAQLANPIVGKILAASPVLLKKSMEMYGIESSRQIQEVQRVLVMLATPPPAPPPNNDGGKDKDKPDGLPQQGGPNAPPVKQTQGGPQPGPPPPAGAGRTGPAPAGMAATSAQIGGAR